MQTQPPSGVLTDARPRPHPPTMAGRGWRPLRQGALDDWYPVHQLQLASSVVAVEFLVSERQLRPRDETNSESFKTALEVGELDVPCYDRDQPAGPSNYAGNLGWLAITADAHVGPGALAAHPCRGGPPGAPGPAPDLRIGAERSLASLVLSCADLALLGAQRRRRDRAEPPAHGLANVARLARRHPLSKGCVGAAPS